MCLRMSVSLQVEMIPICKSKQVYAGKNVPVVVAAVNAHGLKKVLQT